MHVLEQFRAGKKEADEKKMALMRANAHSYATLLSSISELKSLRALDSGEKLDPRDKIRATASRVGLSVPSFADQPLPEFLPKKTAKEYAREAAEKKHSGVA